MIVLFLVLSLAGVAVSLALPGYSNLLLVAGPCALASLWLLLRDRRAARRGALRYLVIDGSNVMHWGEGPPSLDLVAEVVKLAAERGFTPGVVFDANAGYRLGGGYLGSRDLARRLRLPADRVQVVDKGTIADVFILRAARGLNARVVTADRYRDHAADYPEVAAPGTLIRGGVRDGKVWVAWE